MEPSETVKIEETAKREEYATSLIIEPTTIDHEGPVKITAVNDVGTAEETTQLTITSKRTLILRKCISVMIYLFSFHLFMNF